MTTPPADAPARCDFCRLLLPEGAAGQAVTRERDGVTYRFCSTACVETLADQKRVFAEYHGGGDVAHDLSYVA